uniref:Cytosol aminopeptidase domain-containing protein n=1 Tax=Palpitomonas bilix TaxID=652834 RepID=A0A7S3GLN3_9EUKA|mmetsp:Transcript_8627/g.23184  ORF Transcript_8627/g.23184 Transcript_8627/m.23184 type:complete len:507 (+) Transcript_8627:13-1533(+)
MSVQQLDARFASNMGGVVPMIIPTTSAVYVTDARPPSLCELVSIEAVNDHSFEGVVVVTDGADAGDVASRIGDLLSESEEAIKELASVDKTFGSSVSMHCIPGLPGSRLVVAPTGPVDRDIDDARRYFEAASAGVQRASAAGAASIALVLDFQFASGELERAKEVAVLGALDATYVQLEAREHGVKPSITKIGVVGVDSAHVSVLSAMHAGTSLAKDIGESDPERATPANIVDILAEAFKSTNVSMHVHKDEAEIRKEFPLAHAVARCSYSVARHAPRIVKLEYRGESGSNRRRRLYLVGKGIVYDTGGADIKAGGIMFGMSRDKCGAAAVAGFMYTVSKLAPKDLDVVVMLSFVRNSVGSNAYVSDEIIRSHSGVYVKVGNTDAEGRMAMADPLSHLREQAVKENKDGDADVMLATVATLTGHVVRAYGTAYTALVPNGPAKAKQFEKTLADNGHLWADPFEVSPYKVPFCYLCCAHNSLCFIPLPARSHLLALCSPLPYSLTLS